MKKRIAAVALAASILANVISPAIVSANNEDVDYVEEYSLIEEYEER